MPPARMVRGATTLLFPALLLLTLAFRSAFAQVQEPSQLPQPPQGRVPFRQGRESSQDPAIRRVEEGAARKRNIERQRRMVADTEKILELARELSGEIDVSGKEKPSVAVAKRAEEIEKLARNVKDQMKSN